MYGPELSLDGDGLLGEGDLDGLREVRRRRVEPGLVRVPVDHVRQAVGACLMKTLFSLPTPNQVAKISQLREFEVL